MCKTKCFSKRNNVYRINKDNSTFIFKQFSSDIALKNEVNILNLLNSENANVPKIISIHNDELSLEDLGDVTLLDWLEEAEKNSSRDYHDIILKLMSYMHDFYRITKKYFETDYILYDVNLRNFMVKDNKIYGVDFEQSRQGQIETDVGKMIAYIVSYDPIGTEWKIKFCNDFVHIFSLNFNIDMIKMLNNIEWELKSIQKRRNITIDIDSIIFKIAEEII